MRLLHTAGQEYEEIFGMLASFMRKTSQVSPLHPREASSQSHKKEGSGNSRRSIYPEDDDVMTGT